MWETVKLGEICNFEGGSQPPKKEFVYEPAEGYVRFLQIRDFKSDKNITYIPIAKKNRLCAEDDILIGRYGASVGQILSGLTGAYNVALMKIIPNEEVISKGWLSAYLTSTLFQHPLMKVSSRSAQNGFSKDDIYDFAVPLPPLAEQQRIVAKLDAAFAEINGAIGAAKKQANAASDYGYRIIKISLEELSEKYGLSSISKVAVIQPEKKLALEKLSESDDVSFMGMDGLGIKKKYSQPEKNRKLSEVYKSYQYFEDDDVIFAKITPCFENGKLGIVKGLTNGIGFGSSEFVVLRTHADFQSEFLYYCLLNEVFRNDGAANMSGAVGHKRVTKEYFYNYNVPTPPLELQQLIIHKFDEVWKNTTKIISSKHKKLEELTNLKSAILAQELQSEAA